MNLTIDTLTDKIMEALGTEKGWFLVNGILKEEIPRIVTREIHNRVESFVNEFKQTQLNGGEDE